ncbi:MAG: prepilin peptidase [Armatimonadetes bacterium]|nr:prepilin peptidase [Armatimonadota bacterium]
MLVSGSETALIGVLLVAVVTDVRTGKIKNWLTLPAIASGPILHWFQSGNHQALLSLAGIGIMILVAAFLVTFRIVGGGDAKLLVAVGSLAGLPLIKSALLFTGVAGGVFSLMILLRHNGVFGLAGRLARAAWLKLGLKVSVQDGISGSRIKLPYSIPIAAGTIAALFWQL